MLKDAAYGVQGVGQVVVLGRSATGAPMSLPATVFSSVLRIPVSQLRVFVHVGDLDVTSSMLSRTDMVTVSATSAALLCPVQQRCRR